MFSANLLIRLAAPSSSMNFFITSAVVTPVVVATGPVAVAIPESCVASPGTAATAARSVVSASLPLPRLSFNLFNEKRYFLSTSHSKGFITNCSNFRSVPLSLKMIKLFCFLRREFFSTYRRNYHDCASLTSGVWRSLPSGWSRLSC